MGIETTKALRARQRDAAARVDRLVTRAVSAAGAGSRQINRVLHIMAAVQLRNPTEGRASSDRRKAEGKTRIEAMRAFKRRLSNIVYRTMLDDEVRTSPGGSRVAMVYQGRTGCPG